MRIILFSLAASVCFLASARGATVVLQGAAQGTTYHIKIARPPETLDAKWLKADVEAKLSEIDKQMSTYRSDSEISRFNAAPAGEWFSVSPPVRNLVSLSRQISEKTDGAQDVTVGPLVRLWHFGPSKTPSPQPSPKGRGSPTFSPPTDEQIREARTKVGYQKLDFRYDREGLRKQLEGMEVDLSSIAQGYTVDALTGVLRRDGAKDFMVELGGEVYAQGKRPDDTPWRIAIERPLAGKREMESAVTLSNAGLTTAGGSRHFFEYHGKRYSHIINPATGRPVENALSSVTVAADSCTEADGWDTPLVVLGLERGKECAEKNGIAALFLSHTDSGDEVRTTTAWKKRFGPAADGRQIP